MFGSFSREEKKTRVHAARCVELAKKVWNYRRDLMTEAEGRELLGLSGTLKELLRNKAARGPLALAAGALETSLKRVGASIYPRTLLAENVEFVLILAIVVIGFRAYFVQNFVIPTNSMWPTYNGMTPQVFVRPTDEPNPLTEAARILTVGAWPHRINAPADGEVLIPIGGSESLGYIHCQPVPGRSLLIFPSKDREYSFLVGDRTVKTRVPVDFDLDWAVYDGFFSDGGTYSRKKLSSAIESKLEAGEYLDILVDGEPLHCIRTGKQVRAGDRLFAFDELTGDKVFVDRMSYNFVRPKVGSGFVFRTGRIPGIAQIAGDIYYIKRLVGLPGDTLEVKGTTLLRNGAPIKGSEIFDANSRQLGIYPGYEASGLLRPGATVQVNAGNYFAMGDNSPNSSDGRVWGFVPAKEVLGRPIGIYYPLARWGLAR